MDFMFESASDTIYHLPYTIHEKKCCMLKNFFLIALRNLRKNKFSSLINIGGLAVGMAVSILIGLWILDEYSFDKNFPNHDRIAQVMQNQWINNETQTWSSEAFPLGEELRNTYGSNFKHVIMSGWTGGHILSYGDKHIKESGNYMEPGITDMLSLNMQEGNRSGLKDPASILISESTAKALFGDADPMNKRVKIDNKLDVQVTGVYKDLPFSSSFADLHFIAPWQLFAESEHFATRFNNPWGASWFQTFVQIADNAKMDLVSAKIRDAKLNRIRGNDDVRFKPALFLQPMSRWHLYGEFKNGVNTGGRIQYVWLFGIIGIFVLLLACINFMNLSTARSEKRAKEVGIRKSIGSLRRNLITQFYCESFLIALFAFVFSIILVQLSLSFFNGVAGKRMSIPWSRPLFWLCGLGFSLITGLIAGSYPALYLSSFNPVTVLKGSFRAGRLAALPRKILVILQFTVSVIMIVGTIVIFQQIQFARNRPVGYDRGGLVMIPLQTEEINKHFDVVRNELLKSGAVTQVAESENPVTDNYITNSGFQWRGKDPNLQEEFVSMAVSYDFGKTVGWRIKDGRDLSRDFPGDSTALIVNEAAAKFMGFQHPVGEIVKWGDNDKYTIIGVVKDLVSRSPYETIRPTLYYLPRFSQLGNVNLRINPQVSASDALAKIGTIFKRYDPAAPFVYKFADEEYAKKFDNEERIGRLSSGFAILAIFISCLGLFGMASFMAEQRVKEIGVRKVLGASLFNLWRLLSKEFVLLISVSLVIAIPASYYFMHRWLLNYDYRTGISWWIFAATVLGAILITLLTVSYQSIKAALANPVDSLRAE
jgi:ABC-type lipoprotein release transport system permease subunit